MGAGIKMLYTPKLEKIICYFFTFCLLGCGEINYPSSSGYIEILAHPLMKKGDGFKTYFEAQSYLSTIGMVKTDAEGNILSCYENHMDKIAAKYGRNKLEYLKHLYEKPDNCSGSFKNFRKIICDKLIISDPILRIEAEKTDSQRIRYYYISASTRYLIPEDTPHGVYFFKVIYFDYFKEPCLEVKGSVEVTSKGRSTAREYGIFLSILGIISFAIVGKIEGNYPILSSSLIVFGLLALLSGVFFLISFTYWNGWPL